MYCHGQSQQLYLCSSRGSALALLATAPHAVAKARRREVIVANHVRETANVPLVFFVMGDATKPRQARRTPRDSPPGAPGETLTCAACGVSKDAAGYSKNQWNGKNGRCIACVDRKLLVKHEAAVEGADTTSATEAARVLLDRMSLGDGLKPEEKRCAPDGHMYTRSEFESFFGGLEEWHKANPVSAAEAHVAPPVTISPPPPPPPRPIFRPVANGAPSNLIVGNLSKKGAKPPPGVTDVRVDRQTAFGNPFPMGGDGHDERFRDAVCEACEEVMREPESANVDAIAAKYGLRVDSRFKEASSRRALSDAMSALEARVRAGESLRLMCWCHPKRCHADGIIKVLRERLSAPAAKATPGGGDAPHAGGESGVGSGAAVAGSAPSSTAGAESIVTPGAVSAVQGRGRGRGGRGRSRVSRLQ